jgi:hypothetical protein
MTRRPMQDLPRNTRFVYPPNARQYVVTTPAADDPDGWVEVIDVYGGDGGIFSRGQVEGDVEVLP